MRLQTPSVLSESIIELLLDLQLVDPAADEGTAYRIWSKVIRDPLIFKRTLDLPRNPHFPAMALSHSPSEDVVRAMPAKEKSELRDRVLKAFAQ